MRLKPAYTERQTEIAKVGRDGVVETLDLVQGARLSLSEFAGFDTDFCRWLAAFLFEPGIPAPHFFPARKRSHLDGWGFRFLRSFLFLFVLVFTLILVLLFFLDVRTGPGINAAAVLFGDFGIVPWLRFQLDGAVFRNVELQLLVQHRAGLREVVLHPELSCS